MGTCDRIGCSRTDTKRRKVKGMGKSILVCPVHAAEAEDDELLEPAGGGETESAGDND